MDAFNYGSWLLVDSCRRPADRVEEEMKTRMYLEIQIHRDHRQTAER